MNLLPVPVARDLLPLVHALPDLDARVAALLSMAGVMPEPALYVLPCNGDGTSTRGKRRDITMPPGAGLVITNWFARASTVTGPSVFRPGVMVRLEPDGDAKRRAEHQLAIAPTMYAPIFCARTFSAAIELPAAALAGNYLATTKNDVAISGFFVRSPGVFNFVRDQLGSYFSRIIIHDPAEPRSLRVPDARWRVHRVAYTDPDGGSLPFRYRLGDMQFPRDDAPSGSGGVGPAWAGQAKNARKGSVWSDGFFGLRQSPVDLTAGDLVEFDPYNATTNEADGSIAFLHVQGAAW